MKATVTEPQKSCVVMGELIRRHLSKTKTEDNSQWKVDDILLGFYQKAPKSLSGHEKQAPMDLWNQGWTHWSECQEEHLKEIITWLISCLRWSTVVASFCGDVFSGSSQGSNRTMTPKHTPRQHRGVLKTSFIPLGDLNPVEHLWTVLKMAAVSGSSWIELESSPSERNKNEEISESRCTKLVVWHCKMWGFAKILQLCSSKCLAWTFI